MHNGLRVEKLKNRGGGMIDKSKQYVPVNEFTREYVKIAIFEVFGVFMVSLSATHGISSWLFDLGPMVLVLPFCAAGTVSIFNASMIDGAIKSWVDNMLVVRERDESTTKVINENPSTHMYITQDDEEDVPFEVQLTWAEIKALIIASGNRTYLTRDSLEGHGIKNLTRKWQNGHFKYAAMSMGIVDKNMRFVVGGGVVPEVEDE